jgi:hypothetical protein
LSLSLTSVLAWPLTFRRRRFASASNPSDATPRQRPARNTELSYPPGPAALKDVDRFGALTRGTEPGMSAVGVLLRGGLVPSPVGRACPASSASRSARHSVGDRAASGPRNSESFRAISPSARTARTSIRVAAAAWSRISSVRQAGRADRGSANHSHPEPGRQALGTAVFSAASGVFQPQLTPSALNLSPVPGA